MVRLAQQHGMNPASLNREDGYAEFLNTVLFNETYAMPDNRYINDGNDYWELHIQPEHFQDFYRINQILYFKGHD